MSARLLTVLLVHIGAYYPIKNTPLPERQCVIKLLMDYEYYLHGAVTHLILKGSI